jgi:hypothetical protein
MATRNRPLDTPVRYGPMNENVTRHRKLATDVREKSPNDGPNIRRHAVAVLHLAAAVLGTPAKRTQRTRNDGAHEREPSTAARWPAL